MLNFNNFAPFPSVSIVDFEQVNVSWAQSLIPLCMHLHLAPEFSIANRGNIFKVIKINTGTIATNKQTTVLTLLTITCSKLTIETLEKGVKYVQG